jgi:hypothetical protein
VFVIAHLEGFVKERSPMVTVLSLIGVAILTVFLLVSFKRQRQTQSEQKRERKAERHNPAAQAQQEQSRERRAGVRAAHQERARVAASVGPAGSADSGADE